MRWVRRTAINWPVQYSESLPLSSGGRLWKRGFGEFLYPAKMSNDENDLSVSHAGCHSCWLPCFTLGQGEDLCCPKYFVPGVNIFFVPGNDIFTAIPFNLSRSKSSGSNFSKYQNYNNISCHIFILKPYHIVPYIAQYLFRLMYVSVIEFHAR